MKTTITFEDFDIVEALLEAPFQLFATFVESDDFDIIDWHDWENEILYLYHWWTEIRPERAVPYDNIDLPDDYMYIDNDGHLQFNGEKYPDISQKLKDADQKEQEYVDEDQAMLERLIKLRLVLWT